MGSIGVFLRKVAGEVGRALVRFSVGAGDGGCGSRDGAVLPGGKEAMNESERAVVRSEVRKEGGASAAGEVSSASADMTRVRWKPRPVICTDADGDEMRFGSIREASEATMVSSSSILAVCCGRRSRVSAGGYRWRFEDPTDVEKKPLRMPTVAESGEGQWRGVVITAEDEARFQRAKDIYERGIDWVCGDRRRRRRFVSSLRTAGDDGFAGGGDDEMTESRKSELLKRYGMGTKRVRDRVTRRRVAQGGGWGGDGRQDAFRGCPIVGKYPRVPFGDEVREGEDRAEGVKDGV